MAIRLSNRKELDEVFPKKGIQEIRRNYEILRNELQTGDLIFLSGNHWLSNLIKLK
jgi:hypothetical protein